MVDDNVLDLRSDDPERRRGAIWNIGHNYRFGIRKRLPVSLFLRILRRIKIRLCAT